jgi:hydrogenase expression/formation protein HypE
MQNLIKDVFFNTFDDRILMQSADAALLPAMSNTALAMTTDSFVINPLFFPGGNIGSLAVHGTVNDLAACAAKPEYLSVGFILEEGFPMDQLKRIVQSMKDTAAAVGARIVCGDTKVVNRGACDGIFINTTGVGRRLLEPAPAPQQIQAGDRLILSGDIGRHGIAIMALREGLEFGTPLESDAASIWSAVDGMLEAGIKPHCIRDLTRGGLGAALIELAETAGFNFSVQEEQVAVCSPVASACEILGLDPLFVANEGRFLCVVPPGQADRACRKMREFDSAATIIGEVTTGRGTVVMQQPTGVKRRLLLPTGEQLPRIC